MVAPSRRWDARGMHRILMTALASAALLVPAADAVAAPGDLDTSFSGDGRALIDLGGQDFGQDVAIQPDGKIVIAASSGNDAGRSDFVVTRLNGDGSPDDTFSDDGKVQFSFALPGGVSNDRPRAVALAPDGAIVVAGTTDANAATTGKDVAVARLTEAGVLDSSFNGTGRRTVNFAAEENGADVEVRPDGSVVVGGTALIGGDNDFTVARLTAQGKPDTTWSGDGLVTTHFQGTESIRAIALTADGGVVAVGSFQFVSTSTDTAIARYKEDGALDPQFKSGGKLLLSLGGKDTGTDVAVQPDGRIVISALVVGTSVNSSVISRLSPLGETDAGFGDAGRTTIAPGTPTLPDAIALTSAGRIVIAGQIGGGPHPNDILVAELDREGRPDSAFAGDGVTQVDLGDTDLSNAIAVAGDQAVVTGATFPLDVAVVALEIDEPEAQSSPSPPEAGDPAPAPAPETPADPGQPGAAPAQPAPAPAPARDTTAPAVTKLKLAAVRGTEKGSFRLSEQATVRVVVQRKVRRGGRSRLVAARTVKLKGKAGVNRFKLKKLRAGGYRVTVKATDGAGNGSKAVRASFALKKRR